jgi:hypothetical protein
VCNDVWLKLQVGRQGPSPRFNFIGAREQVSGHHVFCLISQAKSRAWAGNTVICCSSCENGCTQQNENASGEITAAFCDLRTATWCIALLVLQARFVDIVLPLAARAQYSKDGGKLSPLEMHWSGLALVVFTQGVCCCHDYEESTQKYRGRLLECFQGCPL